MEPVKMIGIKLDRERDSFVRDKAIYEKRPVTSVIAEAIDFLRARIRIEKHLELSLERNMSTFPNDFAGFTAWLHSQGKVSNYGGIPVTSRATPGVKESYTWNEYISAETFRFLRQWQAELPEKREDFMQYVVLRYELWLRPEDLIDELQFADHETPAPAKIGRAHV